MNIVEVIEASVKIPPGYQVVWMDLNGHGRWVYRSPRHLIPFGVLRFQDAVANAWFHYETIELIRDR